MLASVSVLGRAELGSFGVVICVGIDMFIVSFTVQFACLCDNDVCLSNAGVVVSGFEEHILCIELCECSRLVHEVVEVTKLLGSLYLCGCFLRERCDACNLQHHGVRQ